ncbi:hypothetical protein GCM10012287_36360 [Streptomyces daqingensis]|uniref:Uncharacterized protein n=1 Tax=Streptomyces daqingensis TaxID=1472640 RepID=A0ABQ2MGX5_9ACTN|nr:hypothetical protein GCM10012287_36360 [Streptomyces daqingensis]
MSTRPHRAGSAASVAFPRTPTTPGAQSRTPDRRPARDRTARNGPARNRPAPNRTAEEPT